MLLYLCMYRTNKKCYVKDVQNVHSGKARPNTSLPDALRTVISGRLPKY